VDFLPTPWAAVSFTHPVVHHLRTGDRSFPVDRLTAFLARRVSR
jgi:hypothetical protein